MSTKGLLLSWTLVLLGSIPLAREPRDDPWHPAPWCGTHPGILEEQWAFHQYHRQVVERQRRLALVQHPAQEATVTPEPVRAPLNADVGDIALVENDGTLVAERNPFDLKIGIDFVRNQDGSYSVRVADQAFDSDLGNRVTPIADDDSLGRTFPGFSFPFYGQAYTHYYLNDDGNISFVQDTPPGVHASRSLRRFVNTLPRIAPFFRDLDSGSVLVPADGGVFVRETSDMVQVTWKSIPDFDGPRLHTFQVQLFRDGRIRFGFDELGTQDTFLQDAIVGISPGGNTQVAAVDYSTQLPLENIPHAIAEVFSTSERVDDISLVRKFYETHQDGFDLVAFWANFPQNISSFAFEVNVSNNVSGIGLGSFNFAPLLGSAGRLQSYQNMSWLSRYPTSPTQSFLGTNNALDILAQESGHRWLAFLRFKDPGSSCQESDNRGCKDLLGRDEAHWNFFHDTDASELEGNDIQDNGNGSFTTIGATEQYSPLDLYAMGLIGPEEVPGFFYVNNPTVTDPGRCGSNLTRSSAPCRGATFTATRVNLTMQDVINAEGPRTPAVSVSQKSFRHAFLLLVKRGAAPTQAELDQISGFRSAWQEFFSYATTHNGQARGRMDATLAGLSKLTSFRIPFYEGNSSKFTGLAIVNNSSAPAVLQFVNYGEDGKSALNPSALQLGPGQQLARLGSEVFNVDASAAQSGWIEIQSDNPNISSLFLTGNLASTNLDGAPVLKESAPQLVFSRVLEGTHSFGPVTTEFHVVNPGSSTARVTFTLRAPDGSSLNAGPLPIPPRGKLLRTVTELFGSGRLSGHVEVYGDQNLVGFQRIKFDDTLLGLPAQITPTATRLYSAQMASGLISPGNAFFTEVQLVNPTDAAASVTLTLTDQEGRVRGVPVTVPVPAHGSLQRGADELFGLGNPRTAPIVVGSILLETTVTGVLGDVIFGDPFSARFMASLPLQTQLVTGALFNHVAQGRVGDTVSFLTGVAISNPGTSDAEVTLQIFNRSGAKTGEGKLTVKARGRISKLLDELIPGFQQIGGYMKLASTAPITTFSLFGSTTGTFLSAIPASPF
ncbi:MAG: hypothetical protein HY652_06440 [Acidobacteria bacterium]|nr:hypothetical protein [Acidobacteriota bacterium]